MKAVEVSFIVEGFTEQAFVREVLAPEMACRNVFLSISRAFGTSGTQEGDVRFERAREEIGRQGIRDER